MKINFISWLMTSVRVFICYLCALIFLACSSTSSSISSFDNLSQTKDNDAFQITVSGDGPTKDQAVQSALRNAIEQSYGTFLSSNTKFLNDELIQDEITSVAQGNILGYDLISVAESKQGITAFLTAQVSLTKLAQFGQSKGQSVSVNSNVVYMNAKKEDFYEKNEYQVVQDYIASYNNIALVDYKLDVGDPVRCSPQIRDKWFYYDVCPNSAKNTWVYPIEIKIISNETYKEFYFGLIKLLENISIDEKTKEFRGKSGFHVGELTITDEIKIKEGSLAKSVAMGTLAAGMSYGVGLVTSWQELKRYPTQHFSTFYLRNNSTIKQLIQETSLFFDVAPKPQSEYIVKNSHINSFVRNKIFNEYNLFFEKKQQLFSLKPRKNMKYKKNDFTSLGSELKLGRAHNSDPKVINDLSCLIDERCKPIYKAYIFFEEDLFKDVTGFEIRPKY
jgi:hypothetical protein